MILKRVFVFAVSGANFSERCIHRVFAEWKCGRTFSSTEVIWGTKMSLCALESNAANRPYFQEHEVNLVHIESRPSKTNPGCYEFLVEVEDRSVDGFPKLMDSLKEQSMYVYVHTRDAKGPTSKSAPPPPLPRLCVFTLIFSCFFLFYFVICWTDQLVFRCPCLHFAPFSRNWRPFLFRQSKVTVLAVILKILVMSSLLKWLKKLATAEK